MAYRNSEGYSDPTAGVAIADRSKQDRLRAITWDDYGIDRDRFQELKHFCLQYRRKKVLAASYATSSAPAIRYDKEGGGSGGGSISPTERDAIRHAERSLKAREDCRIMEEAAMWAAGAGGFDSLWKTLLEAVSKGYTYTEANRKYRLPICSTDYYGLRRAFFHRLDQLQIQRETSKFLKVV